MKIPVSDLGPTSAHRLKINKLIRKLRTIFILEFQVFGSIRKDTYIKNHKEIDLFFKGPSLEEVMLHFNKVTNENSLFQNILVKRMGHPYYCVKFYYLGTLWSLDLVPYIGTVGHSDVERSSLHVKEITSKTQEGLLLVNSARWLKNLFNQYQLYGAESSVEGFSGYSCEVLSINSSSCQDILLKLNSSYL